MSPGWEAPTLYCLALAWDKLIPAEFCSAIPSTSNCASYPETQFLKVCPQESFARLDVAGNSDPCDRVEGFHLEKEPSSLIKMLAKYLSFPQVGGFFL